MSGVAAGLAIKNGVDAAKDVAKSLTDGVAGANLGVTVSANLGFSKSKSTSASTEQTTLASRISGGDVNIRATGVPGASSESGTVRVIGSDVTAVRDLTVTAPGSITFASATQTATTAGQSSSFGVSLGVSAGVSVNAKGQVKRSEERRVGKEC